MSGEPVRANTMWVTIDREGDDTVEFMDNDINNFRIEISVGDEAYILVEAPGYRDWDIMLSPDASDYVELTIELMPLGQRASQESVAY